MGCGGAPVRAVRYRIEIAAVMGAATSAACAASPRAGRA